MPSLIARLRARRYDQVSVGALHAAVIALVTAMTLVAAIDSGRWLSGHKGGDIIDFAAFWASARAAWGGHPAWAYDWARLRPILEHAFGQPVKGAAPVYYPPSLLLMIAPLGALSYGWAIALWCAAGLAAFLAVAWRVLPRRATLVIALAAPGVLGSLLVGQNGLLTAALIGGGLLCLERRPWLAGVLFGLLCFKPQMALLVPVALLAGGRWRTLASMAATAAAVLALSYAAFGAETFRAFLAANAQARTTFAHAGWLSWAKVQTVYGGLRQAGVGVSAAWAGQAAATLAAAVAVAALWRGRASTALAAAGLCAATLVATPYAFIYDGPVLGLGALFLLRDARERGRLPPVLAVAAAVAFLAPFFTNPVPFNTLGAVLLLGVILVRAWTRHGRITEISPRLAHPQAMMEAST